MTDLRDGAAADAGQQPGGPVSLAAGYHRVGPGKLVNAVIWLEMRTRPSALPAEPLRLVPADDANRPGLRKLFADIGTPWLWSRARGDTGDCADSFIAEDEADCPVGLVELSHQDPGQVEIVYFGLVPGKIGSGLGRRMMAATLTIAWQHAERVWLHTCSFDHPAALKFYRSCGFVPYASGFEIMDDPRLDGRLPPDAAPHIPMIGGT